VIAYTPSGQSGAFDTWTGVPIAQPATPSSVRSGVADAAYFGIEVENNLLGLINASVASPFYRRSWTCAAGLATGNPVRISGSGTVGLAEATGSGTSDVVGFVRDKSGTTTCYIAHFWMATGITGTVGATAYLQNAGTIGDAAGTFARPLGVYGTTTTALVCALPNGANNVIDARLLAETVTATISGNAESGNYRAVTVQLKDVRGTALTSRVLVEAWLADTGYGWETATAATGLTMSSGTTGDTPTAGKRMRGITAADGSITFLVNTDAVRTYVFCASIRGKVYTSTLAFA